MRTAFAQLNDRIAPVFDAAHQIWVVETESGRILHQWSAVLSEGLMLEKALQLAALKIDTLVCGAISRPLEAMTAGYGIRVVSFVAGDLREVVTAWYQGRLGTAAFAMPGCRSRHRFRGRHEFSNGLNNAKEVHNARRKSKRTCRSGADDRKRSRLLCRFC